MLNYLLPLLGFACVVLIALYAYMLSVNLMIDRRDDASYDVQRGPFTGLPVWKRTTFNFSVRRYARVWTGRYIECEWVNGDNNV